MNGTSDENNERNNIEKPKFDQHRSIRRDKNEMEHGIELTCI